MKEKKLYCEYYTQIELIELIERWQDNLRHTKHLDLGQYEIEFCSVRNSTSQEDADIATDYINEVGYDTFCETELRALEEMGLVCLSAIAESVREFGWKDID